MDDKKQEADLLGVQEIKSACCFLKYDIKRTLFYF